MSGKKAKKKRKPELKTWEEDAARGRIALEKGLAAAREKLANDPNAARDAERAAAEHRREKSGRPASAASRLVELALEQYDLHVDDRGAVFATPREGVRHVALRIRGGRLGFRQALAAMYLRLEGKVATQQALADALAALEGIAQTLPPERLHLRVADHQGAIYIDLGDRSGHVARIADRTWTVQTEAPILFTQTELGAAMPVPERGGDLEDLWTHINLPEEERGLLLAVLVSAFVENMPHPVLDFEGEQGSGKSTAVRRIVDLLDPSTVPLRKPPRDVDAWTLAAVGSWLVALDNLSGVPEWLSDSLCRASTGDGDVRRQLYTDGGYSVVNFRRVVLLNGIDVAGMKADLVERLVTIRLRRIDHGRRGEREMDAAWGAGLPRLLGALLDLVAIVWDEIGEVSEVRPRTLSGEVYPFLAPKSTEEEALAPLARHPRAEKARSHASLTSPPRMADFARIVAAVDDALGTEALTRYAEHAAGLAAETLTASPFVSAMLATVTTPFEGTADTLMRLVTSRRPDGPPPRNWPTNPKAVTGELRRNGPALRQQGWVVQDREDRKNHRAVWTVRPPVEGDEPPVLRCTVCSDALTTEKRRRLGVCGKQDPEHDAARVTAKAAA